MAIRLKLTPEAFVSAPRRSAAVPSPSGRIAFLTRSTHTIGEGTKKEVLLVDLGSGAQWSISEDDKVHDVKWIPDESSETLAWLRDAGEGETQLSILPSLEKDDQSPDAYVAGTIPGLVKAIKFKDLDDGSIACAVVGLVGPDGSLFNPETAEKPASSARIYDSLLVREWDTYVKPQKYSIFYSRLVKEDGKWELASPFQDALRGTDLESPGDVYEPGDAGDGFDIGRKGLVFAARSFSARNLIEFSSREIYFLPLESFAAASIYKPTRIALQGDQAPYMSKNPRFSPDGTMIAFLMVTLKDPADTRLYMGHIGSGASFDVFRLVIGETWNLVPSEFEYAPSGDSLFVLVGDCGRNVLYELELKHKAKPRRIVKKEGSVSAFYPVKTAEGSKNALLVSGSSIVESSYYLMVDLDLTFEPRIVSTADGTRYGLSHQAQVSEIYFEGAGDYCVQAWVVRPSDFDESKKYPLALHIHGGPESAWNDEWHPRWTAALWAEQGYVVVLPNITGSTGFGVEHTTRVYADWGGPPYQDLVNCMEYLANIPYIDMDRAIVAGASYGGYMVNWILGHPLAQKFKAAVTHDSVFSTETMTLMSDASDGVATWKGPAFPWSNFDALNNSNPARHDLLKNWKDAPPTLVIHSDQDFRCPVTDGIAVFKTLQYQGVPSRLLSFPDESHFVQKPENALVWCNTVFEWVNKYSGITDERARVDG